MQNYKKIETHCHSYPISGCSRIPAGSLAPLYKAQGFDTVILTNHYADLIPTFGATPREQIDAFLKNYEIERESGKEVGVNVLLGAEVFVPHPKAEGDELKWYNGDFLLFGLKPSLLYEYYPLHYFSQKRLFEFCCAYDILLIQAHPYRTAHHCLPADLTQVHGLEVYNPHVPVPGDMENSVRDASANHLLMTAGTDCHYENEAGNAYMMIPREVETIEDFPGLSENRRSDIWQQGKGHFSAGRYTLKERPGLRVPSPKLR